VRIAIDLTPTQANHLHLEATRLGVPPEDLARAAVLDLISSRPEDFRKAAEYVLLKNRELYERLA
jgi:hypothetical protein